MSFAIVENGQITVYQDKSAFTSNGVEYPKFWYVGALDFQRQDAGCVPVVYEDMADENLYWNAEQKPYFDANRGVVVIKHTHIERPKDTLQEEVIVDGNVETVTLSSANSTISLDLGSASETILGT